MNLVKNLLIIAVLAAVGYGVYVSLARNNADPSSPPGVAEGWPTVPKVEMPQVAVNPPSGSSLPLSAPSSPLAMGGSSPQAASPSVGLGVTPPFTLPPAGGSLASPPSNPIASLGPPTSPEAATTMTMPNAVANAMGNQNASPAATDRLLQNKFAAFLDAVRKKLDEGKLAEAHAALSALYGNANLPADQARQISTLLDQLAGTVIYSRKHYLEPAYFAQQGDTLERIALRYNVPWQLLARINGLMPPGASSGDIAAKDQPLPVGMELKVVRGPFEAVVHTDRHELTLMLENRYAGRFPIGVGRDLPRVDGNYTVRDKTPNAPYNIADGIASSPNDPRNPPSSPWIGLTDRIGIHAAPGPQAIGRDDNRGAICVGERDLQDLYGILSVGSRVTIMR